MNILLEREVSALRRPPGHRTGDQRGKGTRREELDCERWKEEPQVHKSNVFLLQTLNTSFDNFSDLFVLH